MQHLGLICTILLIIGGLNWLLVGAADMDLVAMLFGAGTTLTRVVYIIVGVAAIIKLVDLIRSRA